MLIITLLLILKPYFSNVFRDTTEDHFVDNFKSYVAETVSEFKKKAMSSDEEFNIPASLVKKRYVLTYLTIKRVGWTVYSTNTLNMVSRISSFAWHASFRLLLKQTVSLVNGIMVFLFCIFNGHNKSRLNPDSYRGITLLSVIFKIFESVLDSLMPQLEATAVYPKSHQCGFQRGLSCLDTSFVLQETINYYNERSDCTSLAHMVIVQIVRNRDFS